MFDGPVAERSTDNSPKRPLRALYQWLKGSTPSPSPEGPAESAGTDLPARMGHYAIERKIGEGGMGVVYAARDERLRRTVALKTMSSVSHDETARQRFWREARAAASVNHPNVCRIYEIGEDNGNLFIAMELLAGKPLSDRLKEGPIMKTLANPPRQGQCPAPVGVGASGQRSPLGPDVLASDGVSPERRVPHGDRAQSAWMRWGYLHMRHHLRQFGV